MSEMVQEMVVNIVLGVFIIVQIERMIRTVSSLSDRLMKLETEHGIYHDSQFIVTNRRSTDNPPNFLKR